MSRQADVLIRAIAAEGTVRAFAINSTRLCERARRIQDSLPTATAALGRVLTGAAMLASTIKEGERISLRVEGDGPLGPVFAQAFPDGRVRGYVTHPHVHLPSKAGKLDVGGAVGKQGYLYVIRDLGMAEPYVGSVPLQSGEIGEDLAYYFTVSEQTPSAVGLGVLVETDDRVVAAGGYIIQLLPGAPEEVISRLEDNIRQAPRPSDLIVTLRDPQAILDVLLAGMDWQPLEQLTPKFFCGCTRTKSRVALRALSVEDLEDITATAEPTRVSCDFCGRAYEFTPEEIAAILQQKSQEPRK